MTIKPVVVASSKRVHAGDVEKKDAAGNVVDNVGGSVVGQQVGHVTHRNVVLDAHGQVCGRV